MMTTTRALRIANFWETQAAGCERTYEPAVKALIQLARVVRREKLKKALDKKQGLC